MITYAEAFAYVIAASGATAILVAYQLRGGMLEAYRNGLKDGADRLRRQLAARPEARFENSL